MSLLLACDPDLRTPALSLWSGGQLVRGWRVRSRETVVRGPRAWEAAAWAAREAIEGLSIDEFLVEGQQYDARTTVAAKDVIELGGVVQRMLCVFLPIAPGRVVLPREWIGSTPKKVRRTRVLAALSAEELMNVESWDEDTVDAVALGLWAVRRRGERR
jgi:hypothetical protein